MCPVAFDARRGFPVSPCRASKPSYLHRNFEVKISVDADELSELEGLSDAELVQMVRDGFKQFRATARDANGNVVRPRKSSRTTTRPTIRRPR
jgi:hypothetical protein